MESLVLRSLYSVKIVVSENLLGARHCARYLHIYPSDSPARYRIIASFINEEIETQ